MSQSELEILFDELPEHIKNDAYHWGLNDTVVRDNIYEWYIEVLEKKGVNLKAARLVMKDLDDVNEESVSRWLDDNADLFGLQVAEKEIPTQDMAALRQQDILTQGAVTPDRGIDIEQRLNNAGSAEEILNLLRSQ